MEGIVSSLSALAIPVQKSDREINKAKHVRTVAKLNRVEFFFLMRNLRRVEGKLVFVLSLRGEMVLWVGEGRHDR